MKSHGIPDRRLDTRQEAGYQAGGWILDRRLDIRKEAG